MKVGRVVYCSELKIRRFVRIHEFESHTFRHAGEIPLTR